MVGFGDADEQVWKAEIAYACATANGVVPPMVPDSVVTVPPMSQNTPETLLGHPPTGRH
jgi:hypothetical protein